MWHVCLYIHNGIIIIKKPQEKTYKMREGNLPPKFSMKIVFVQNEKIIINQTKPK